METSQPAQNPTHDPAPCARPRGKSQPLATSNKLWFTKPCGSADTSQPDIGMSNPAGRTRPRLGETFCKGKSRSKAGIWKRLEARSLSQAQRGIPTA